MRLGLLFLVFLLAPSGVEAQANCATGSAEVDLDVADVRARLYTIGNLFWRGGGAMYEVPRDSGIHAIFSAGLWVGGEVAGAVRFAGSTYGPWEFWPGPLDAQARTTQSRCASFDRFWSVRRADLLAYTATGTSTPNLSTWPIAQGAPFYVDANANGLRDADEPRLTLTTADPGYSIELGQGRAINLAAGERPDIVGDQGVWWVMNDAGNTHAWGGAPALGIEVRVLAYAFDAADPAVRQSTFYQVTITNRSAAVIENLRAGFYADIDIGDITDDYVASDAARGMLVGYNGRDVDDPAQGGYGAAPPALGLDLLSGAAGTYDLNVQEGPGIFDRALNAWRMLQSLHRDGLPLTRGGTGYNPGQTEGITTWHYDGEAAAQAFWTQEQTLLPETSLEGSAETPGDRRALISAPAETLAPGVSREIDLAILFARPEADDARTRLASVVRLGDLSDAVQEAYDAGGPGAIRDAVVSTTPPPAVPAAGPALTLPADEVDLNPDRPVEVAFAWTAVPGATGYRLELSRSPAFDSDVVQRTSTGTSLPVPAADLPRHDGPWTYWRVVPTNWGGDGSASAARRFGYRIYRDDFVAFTVTANGAGALTPPEPGAAPGFPGVAALPDAARQQTNGTRWLLHTGGEFTSYDEFVSRTTRNGANWSSIIPFGFEIRFTGSSLAKVNGIFGQTTPDVTVPFEVWNIGPNTPDDPSDDVRMIPVLLDVDGNGTFNLSTRDSPVDGGANDPTTDWLYLYNPVNMSPGQAGYQAFFANGTGATAQISAEALARLVFVGLDLGTAPPYTAPNGSAVSGPELGTVFRIQSEFRGAVVSGETAPNGPSGLSLAVQPNPVRGQAVVPFSLAAPGDVRLVLVDVLGREVAVLAEGMREAGDHRAALSAGRLASGVYVLVLESGTQRATRRVTVVR